MKKILHCIIIVILTAVINQISAQNNDAFSYQGVLRNEAGTILTSQEIAIKINILNQNEEIEYSEIHNPVTTSPAGIFSILIGRGEVETGSLSSLKELDWGLENYSIQTEVDIDLFNGINFQVFGSSPLVAVPLALHAQTVEDKDDADADPNNEIQNLSYNSMTGELSLSNGNTVTIETSGTDDDADPNNEIQSLSFDPVTKIMSITESNSVDLSSLAGGSSSDDQNLGLNGTTLSIEDGNSVDLTGLKNDDDADPNNEIQFLGFNAATNELSLSMGNTITIPSGGTDADADPTNELQTLNFNPLTNELEIVGGNSVIIPSGGTDADADPTNEIQDIELMGTELSITDGSTIDLATIIPIGGTDDQTLELLGTELTIESGNTIDLAPLQDGTEDADADPANELQTLNFDPLTNELQIVGGNTITIPSGGTDADADPTNEIQDIELMGTELSITDGSTIDLAPLQDGTEDADADPANELQTLNFDPLTNELQIVGGNTITIPSGGTDADADPTNEIQDIELIGTELSITDGSTIDLSTIIPIGGTDDQTLELLGTELTIESGNTIDLAPLQDGTEDADADPANEIQTLNFDPLTNELQIVGGNTVVIPTGGTDADADPTNEIQDIELIGTELSITDGSTIDLSTIIPIGGTDDQTLELLGTELTIESGNTIDLAPLQDGTEDADADPANEIQDIELIGTELSITDGSTIDLSTIIPIGGTDDQTLELLGTELTIESGNTIDLAPLQDGTEDADADPTNEIQTLTFDPLTNELEIVGGNTVTIPTGGSDADADPMNEIQDLSWTENGSTISISDANSIQINRIANASNTSGITVDELTNEIIFDVDGTENVTLKKNLNGEIMLDIDNTNSLFVGRDAGIANTGNANSFLGTRSGAENTSGFANTFVGRNAGESNSEGALNVYIGSNAGRDNELGSANVAIGADTGQNMEGDKNIFIGSGAGNNNSEDENVFIGNFAGNNNDGSNNVFIGNSSGKENNGSNNVFIGSNVGLSHFLDGTSTLLIDAVDTDVPLVYGKFNENFLRINGELQISEEYSFPLIDGAAGQVLQTDGAGNVSWETAATGMDADADPTNELQDLNLVGTEIQITNGIGIDLAGIIPTGGTDDQELELIGNTLSIESGNSVDLGPFISRWGLLADGGGNEIGILYDKQAVVEQGMTITLSDPFYGGVAMNAVNNLMDNGIGVQGISNGTSGIGVQGLATGTNGIGAKFEGRTAGVTSLVETQAGDPGIYYGMRSDITGLGTFAHVGLSGRAFSAFDNYGTQGIVQGGVGMTNNYALHGISFDVNYGTAALLEGFGILESTGINLVSSSGSYSEGISMITNSNSATGIYNGVQGLNVTGQYNYIETETPTSFALGTATEIVTEGDAQGNGIYINEVANGQQKYIIGNAITIDGFDTNSFITGDAVNINSQSSEYVTGRETNVNSNYSNGNVSNAFANNVSSAYNGSAEGPGVNVMFSGTAGEDGTASNGNFGMILAARQGNISQGMNITSYGSGAKIYVQGEASERANQDIDSDLNLYDDSFYASSYSKISGGSDALMDAAVIGLNTTNKVGALKDNFGGIFQTIGEGDYNFGLFSRSYSVANTDRAVGIEARAVVSNDGDGYGGRFFATRSLGSGFAVGLYASGIDFAAQFNGNVDIVGNLSKSGGTFKIDHPQDPENKYLVHSFVESPDMMNIYNGNITTDGDGYATVEMPGYFESLNVDFRYQLTVIGTFAQAIVKEKIENGLFVIQTNEPNIEVSWMVTGVRNDPWAVHNRVVPEVDKGEKRGTYLTPEYYNADPSKAEYFSEGDTERNAVQRNSNKTQTNVEDLMQSLQVNSDKKVEDKAKTQLTEIRKRAQQLKEKSASDLDSMRKEFNKD